MKTAGLWRAEHTLKFLQHTMESECSIALRMWPGNARVREFTRTESPFRSIANGRSLYAQSARGYFTSKNDSNSNLGIIQATLRSVVVRAFSAAT